MIINCKQLFEVEGERISFDEMLNLEDIELWGVHPFRTPVHVCGEIKNRAGIVELAYKAEFTFYTQCDRCLREICRPVCETFCHTLVCELQREEFTEDFILLENRELDMDDLVLNDILLTIPIQTLCKDDCKGLCPTCGANLNDGACRCNHQEIDPRLEALKALLE